MSAGVLALQVGTKVGQKVVTRRVNGFIGLVSKVAELFQGQTADTIGTLGPRERLPASTRAPAKSYSALVKTSDSKEVDVMTSQQPGETMQKISKTSIPCVRL